MPGTPTTEDNKALIRRYYEDLWNRWNLVTADEIIAAGIRFRGSLGVTVAGIDGFKEYVATVRAAFPDFHNTVEELIAEGDQVVARLTYRGTHRGPLFGIAPTGTAVSYVGIAIFRIADRQIAEGWVLGDTLGLMQQLGRRRE
jgi:predicted ester cyclase